MWGRKLKKNKKQNKESVTEFWRNSNFFESRNAKWKKWCSFRNNYLCFCAKQNIHTPVFS